MTKIFKNLVLLGTLVAGVFYFSSCEKYTYIVDKRIPIIDTTGSDTTNLVKFATEIQPIFSAKCIGCHKGTRNPDLREGNSYAALTGGGYVNPPATSSKLYTMLNSGSHSSLTTQEDKNKILLWISQGAKNN